MPGAEAIAALREDLAALFINKVDGKAWFGIEEDGDGYHLLLHYYNPSAPRRARSCNRAFPRFQVLSLYKFLLAPWLDAESDTTVYPGISAMILYWDMLISYTV